MVQLAPTCSFRWVNIHGSNIIFVSGEVILSYYINTYLIYEHIYMFGLALHHFSFAKQSVTFHISATGRFLNEQKPYSRRSWRTITEGNGHRQESHRRKATERNSHKKTNRKKKGREKETNSDGRVSILMAGSVFGDIAVPLLFSWLSWQAYYLGCFGDIGVSLFKEVQDFWTVPLLFWRTSCTKVFLRYRRSTKCYIVQWQCRKCLSETG